MKDTNYLQSCFEKEGIKLILEFPKEVQVNTEMKEEVKTILANELQELLKKIS